MFKNRLTFSATVLAVVVFFSVIGVKSVGCSKSSDSTADGSGSGSADGSGSGSADGSGSGSADAGSGDADGSAAVGSGSGQ